MQALYESLLARQMRCRPKKGNEKNIKTESSSEMKKVYDVLNF